MGGALCRVGGASHGGSYGGWAGPCVGWAGPRVEEVMELKVVNQMSGLFSQSVKRGRYQILKTK